MQLGRLLSSFSASGTQNPQTNTTSSSDPFEMHVVENDEDLLRNFATGGVNGGRAGSASSRRQHLHEPTQGPSPPPPPAPGASSALVRSASSQMVPGVSTDAANRNPSSPTGLITSVATATVVSEPPRPAAVVVAPRATGANGNAPDDDDEANTCGICLEVVHPSLIATLACCKNRLCFDDACRVGACPFCREEPLLWTLEGSEDDEALRLDAEAERLVQKHLTEAASRANAEAGDAAPASGDNDGNQSREQGSTRHHTITAGFAGPSSDAAVVINIPVSSGARGNDSMTSVFPADAATDVRDLVPTSSGGVKHTTGSTVVSSRGGAPPPPTAFQSQVPVCMATPNSPATAITPGGDRHNIHGAHSIEMMPTPSAHRVPSFATAVPQDHQVTSGGGVSGRGVTSMSAAAVVSGGSGSSNLPSVNVGGEGLSTASHSPMLTSPSIGDVNPLSPAAGQRRQHNDGGAFGAHDPYYDGAVNPSIMATSSAAAAAGAGSRIVIPALRLETVAPATRQLAHSEAPLTTSASPPLTGANPSAGHGAYVSAFTLPFAPNNHLAPATGHDTSTGVLATPHAPLPAGGGGAAAGMRLMPPPPSTVRSAASSTKFSPCPSSVMFNASNPTNVPNGGSGGSGFDGESRLNTANPSGAASPVPLQQRLFAAAAGGAALGDQSSQQFVASGSVAGGPGLPSARFGAVPTGMSSVALSGRPQQQQQQQQAPISGRRAAPVVSPGGPSSSPAVVAVAPPAVTSAVSATTTVAPPPRTITIPNRSSGASSLGLGIAVTPPRPAATMGVSVTAPVPPGPSSGLGGPHDVVAGVMRKPLTPGGPGGSSGLRLPTTATGTGVTGVNVQTRPAPTSSSARMGGSPGGNAGLHVPGPSSPAWRGAVATGGARRDTHAL